MKIIRPNGEHTLDVTHKWEIEWEDVTENEPEYAKFWLTHTSTEPYRNPVQLTEPINIRERKHCEVEGRHIEHMPSGGGYRVWAMRIDEDPGLQPNPLSESADLDIKNETHHE